MKVYLAVCFFLKTEEQLRSFFAIFLHVNLTSALAYQLSIVLKPTGVTPFNPKTNSVRLQQSSITSSGTAPNSACALVKLWRAVSTSDVLANPSTITLRRRLPFRGIRHTHPDVTERVVFYEVARRSCPQGKTRVGYLDLAAAGRREKLRAQERPVEREGQAQREKRRGSRRQQPRRRSRHCDLCRGVDAGSSFTRASAAISPFRDALLNTVKRPRLDEMA